MIDARELRIGNWVSYEHSDWEDRQEITIGVGTFAVFSHKLNSYEANYITENINPIPLTAERLERFGFEKSGEYHTMLVGDLISSIYFVVDGVDFSIAIADSISSYEDGSRYLTPELKATRNVHQLQNLYFALTGEELELKTETDA